MQAAHPGESDAKAVRIVLSLKGLGALDGHVVVEVGGAICVQLPQHD